MPRASVPRRAQRRSTALRTRTRFAHETLLKARRYDPAPSRADLGHDQHRTFSRDHIELETT